MTAEERIDNRVPICATLAFNKDGQCNLQYDFTVFGVAIEDCMSSVAGSAGADLGLLMATTTNLWEGASMSLVANVLLPDGYVHIEIADASGEFEVWGLNHETYEYEKIVDSQSSPTRDFPISAWRRFTGRTWSRHTPVLPVYVVSPKPGRATLRFRYWNVVYGLMVDEVEQKLTSVSAPKITMPSVIGVNDDDDNDSGKEDWEDHGMRPVDDDIVAVNVSVGCPPGVAGVVEVENLASPALMWRDEERSQPVYYEEKASFVATPTSSNCTFYIEGQSASRGYLTECIRAKFSFGGAHLEGSHWFTFVKRVAEPITTERTSSGQVCNPCCAIIGESTPLKVSVYPNSFPDYKIKWKVVSGDGAFSDDTGREATFVASGAENADTVVQVDFGDCPGNAPQFTLHTTTMKEVLVYPCVISRIGRPPPVDTSEISDMIEDVNVIYRQVVRHFSLGAPPMNIVDDALSMYGLVNDNMFWQILDIMPSTNRLEVYFIDGTGNDNEPVGSACRSSGVVIRKSAGAETLGHEIGHFFGLDDIYCLVGKNEGTVCPKLRENVKWDWAFQDWNNGSGSSFYALELKQYELIQRLLMYGLESRSKCDIPEGPVYGKPDEGELTDVFVGRTGFTVEP